MGEGQSQVDLESECKGVELVVGVVGVESRSEGGVVCLLEVGFHIISHSLFK